MPTTPINGLRYPALSDNANVPLFVQNLASDVDSRLVAQFANAAARDAITATTGMLAHTANDKRYWRYDGAAWKYAGGAPPPTTLMTVNTGWAANVDHRPQAYVDGSGLVHSEGWWSNDGPFTPNGTQFPVTYPDGMRPTQTKVWTIPLNAPGVGHGSVVVTVFTDGRLRIDSIVSGPSPLPAATGFFLDGVPTFHPAAPGNAAYP